MKIPENTDSFIYYNANPKNRKTSDCVFRAISKFLDQDYNMTIMEMAELSCKNGYCINSKKQIEIYLSNKGLIKHRQPRKDDNAKFTGKEFVKQGIDCIANIGGHHITCIINGKIYDTWDCSDGCIGNYYTKG